MSRLTDRLLFLCVVAASLLPEHAFAHDANLPDWVRQAAALPQKTYSPETEAEVLLKEENFTVSPSGDFIEHSRRVIRLLRPEGHNYGVLRVELNQQDKIESIHGWSFDTSGHEYELKDKDFIEVSPFGQFGVLYDDVRLRAAEAPASRAGSVVGFEYTLHCHPWLNEIDLGLSEPVPVRYLAVSLSLPAGWDFKSAGSVAHGLDPTSTGANQWQWNFRDLPGIEKETMMPPIESLTGRMAIAYYRSADEKTVSSWEGIGHWYTALTASRRLPTPETLLKAQELTRQSNNFDDQLLVLTSFMQSQIRYVAISIGIGGYQPHLASDVFRYRYGDCKDKVTLLSTLLQEVGIRSEYALIDTDRGVVIPQVPSRYFDHVIIAVELPESVKNDVYKSIISSKAGKRYLLFDPTDEYTPVGSLRAELQNSYALLVTNSGGELVRTPLLSPEWNQTTRMGHFVLNADGALSGEVSEDRSGDSAMYERGRLHYTDQRQRIRDFEGWLGRSIQGFSLEDVDIKQADQIQKNLLVKYRLMVPRYAQVRGSLLLVRPRVLDRKSSPVEHKPRRYSLELGRTARETDTYEIEIPKEFQVDEIPDPVKIDVGFASYQSRTEVEGSKLRYSREYLVRDLSVPPEKFADWAKLQGVIDADEGAAVVLKRTP